MEKKTIGSTNRWKYQSEQGLQSACGTSGGLCGNLINALKLLANQQKKGLTQGLREFIKIDNERALEIGYLSQGMGKFKVRRPKVPEGCPEVIVREGPDELTLRA